MQSKPIAIASEEAAEQLLMRSRRRFRAAARRPAGTATDGRASTSFSTSPSGRPAEIRADRDVAAAVVARDAAADPRRRTRARCSPAAPSPARPGTSIERICSTSPRASSLRRTRIGICRSGRLNLGRLIVTSPLVAMRVAALSASVETPSSAARSGNGSMRSSGCSRLADDCTFVRPALRATPLDLLRNGVEQARVVAREADLHLLAEVAGAEGNAHARNVPHDLRGRGFERRLVSRALAARQQVQRQRGAPHVAAGLLAEARSTAPRRSWCTRG